MIETWGRDCENFANGEIKPTDKMYCLPNATKLTSSHFLFHSKIALGPISYAGKNVCKNKCLPAKMFTAKLQDRIFSESS